jgi:hypothetical protein
VTTIDVPQRTAYSGECFRPLAVFDMTGDGVPEIVLRASGWNDVVLQREPDDTWSIVASSPGGSTA